MRIAICDDEKRICAILAEKVGTVAEEFAKQRKRKKSKRYCNVPKCLVALHKRKFGVDNETTDAVACVS